MKYDQLTGRSRGFAFVEFVAAQSVLDVLKEKNREIKGKTVEVKPAKSRENKKIFVGGLPSDYPEDELKAHFEVYGKVDDVEWPWDRSRGLRRNFAFVVFEEESAADKASEQNKQKFGDRVVRTRFFHVSRFHKYLSLLTFIQLMTIKLDVRTQREINA